MNDSIKTDRIRRCARLWATTVVSGFLMILIAGCASSAQRATPLQGWTLVWSDEFSQPDGSAPNPSKWNHDIGGGGWGNNEWQHYTRRTNNARIEGGHLIIEAHAESGFGTNTYTSARLLTRHKADWTYGRIEARIKIPRGQGIWPAFWMLGTNISLVGWPDCGEIDIMENIGKAPRTVHGTIHGPGYSGGKRVGGSVSGRKDLADDFHVFAVEWEASVIRWFFNDKQYFTVTPDGIGDSRWVFDHPHHILLNVAVGGSWPGYPDDTTVFPQQMQVDYVRVYQRTDQADSPPSEPPPSG